MASTTAATADTLVRAAGLLIYRRKASVDEFLLLQASYEPFHWTPPKGHVDPGENEWTAAIREVREEAGIDAMDKLEIHTEFKHEMFYTVKSKPKKVTYWLAKAWDGELKITLSNEHKDWTWAGLERAVELTKFEEMKKMLNAASGFLANKGV